MCEADEAVAFAKCSALGASASCIEAVDQDALGCKQRIDAVVVQCECQVR